MVGFEAEISDLTTLRQRITSQPLDQLIFISNFKT